MDFRILDIPKIQNPKGNIAVIENDAVPFEIRRVYYLFDVPSHAQRGGHAHKNLKQVLIALSGSFDVILKNGKKTETVNLNKPDRGLLIESNIWRELKNFSSGAVCLVIASEVYDEADYIRSFAAYKNWLKITETK